MEQRATPAKRGFCSRETTRLSAFRDFAIGFRLGESIKTYRS
jgi:hypothetical protein